MWVRVASCVPSIATRGHRAGGEIPRVLACLLETVYGFLDPAVCK
jgi:hypothetical protein